MRAERVFLALSALVAFLAAPAPAIACDKHAGAGAKPDCCNVQATQAKPKPGAATPAKPAAPAKPGAAAPAKPAAEDCCKPGADGAKKPCCDAKRAAAGGQKPACCEQHAAGKKDDCCQMPAGAAKPHGAKGGDACCETDAAKPHGAKGGDACCETDAAKPHGAKGGDACCETDAAKPHGGKGDACCDAQHPHQMAMPHHRGMNVRIERRIERKHGWARHFPDAVRFKGPEVRYMPAMGGTNQHLIYARDRRMQINPWLSLGGQLNHGLQIAGTTPGTGPWLTTYGGVLPRLGMPVGPLRADVGALLGVGAMGRTTTIGATNDVLQARLMWVVEPRVELGWMGEDFGAGLVAAYNVNPYQTEFGGLSAGLRLTWKRDGWK